MIKYVVNLGNERYIGRTDPAWERQITSDGVQCFGYNCNVEHGDIVDLFRKPRIHETLLDSSDIVMWEKEPTNLLMDRVKFFYPKAFVQKIGLTIQEQ
jgi:hypothetical protein